MIGMTSNGCSAALPEESFALAAVPERGCELRALGTSAGCDSVSPGTRTWEEGEEKDYPQFRNLTLSRVVLLNGIRSFSLHTPGLPGQHLHPS